MNDGGNTDFLTLPGRHAYHTYYTYLYDMIELNPVCFENHANTIICLSSAVLALGT